jgi:hypothetical protein
MNLKNFSASRTYKEQLQRVVVGLPNKREAFQTSSAVRRDVWVVRINDNWYLVNRELAENGSISGVLLADLHFAMYQNKQLFIIINTRGRNGEKHSWYESMEEIIKLSKTKWMVCDKSQDGCHKAHAANNSVNLPDLDTRLDSLDNEFDDVIASSFEGRIISCLDDLDEF